MYYYYIYYYRIVHVLSLSINQSLYILDIVYTRERKSIGFAWSCIKYKNLYKKCSVIDFLE